MSGDLSDDTRVAVPVQRPPAEAATGRTVPPDRPTDRPIDRPTDRPTTGGHDERAPVAVLTRAWRAAAEVASPTLVLAERDRDHTVLWANRALTSLFGVVDAELVGRRLVDLAAVAADPRSPNAWALVASELLTGWGGQREATVRRVDGSDILVQLDASHICGGSDEPDAWLLGVHPLTDGHQDTQAALREAEHRFRALAESAPVGIFVSEAGLRLGYVNDRFIELTGLAEHQLLGTEWLTAVDPDDVTALYAAAEGVLSGHPRELNVRIVGDGDTPRWMYLRLAPTTTPTRAAGFIGTAEDVTRRRAWEEKITYQAQHDPLTGLVNRRRLVELLQELLSSRRAVDRNLALMFVDLDGFKQINDRYGHDAGDRVLVESGRRMRKVAREYDIVARISGDEFVVILRNILDPMDAEHAARRQLAALSAPFRIGRNEETISASIGVASPGAGDTPDTLLRVADRLMYEAKEAGGSGYRTAAVPEDHRVDHDGHPGDEDGDEPTDEPAGPDAEETRS